MNEKRREKRFQSKQKVWCEGQELSSSAEARDISRGGMSLVTGEKESAEVGSKLKVTFAVPEGEDISLNMEVVWREEQPKGEHVAMGLRVIEFEKGKEAFDRFVADHVKDLKTDRPPPPAAEPTPDKDKKQP